VSIREALLKIEDKKTQCIKRECWAKDRTIELWYEKLKYKYTSHKVHFELEDLIADDWEIV
jgi:hypothetical protein